MSMSPGRHDLTARVDLAMGRPRRPPLDRDDAAALTLTSQSRPGAGAVDQVTAPDQQVVHGRSPTPAVTGAAPARSPPPASGADHSSVAYA